jgi:TetR/AcrR family transcriptional repressor of nem operon
LLKDAADPISALREYPNIFRRSLESDNRLCLCSFMSAEYDDLPDEVTAEVQTFSNVNVAWISKALVAGGVARPENSEAQARAIFAAVAGAQLMARSRSDISLFDALIETYQGNGLLPA